MSGSAPAVIAATPETASKSALGRGLFPRWQDLGVLLCVSFSGPVAASTYYLIVGSSQTPTHAQQTYQLCVGLIREASALLVLWYVMGRQGKAWRDIGWRPSVADIPRAVGLFLLVMTVRWFVWYQGQYLYRAYSGHFLTQRSLHSMFAFGISALSIMYACLNPLFEELIVRGYTISEVVNLTGSRTLAVGVSVVVQLSYHLYQGAANVLLAVPVFLLFSLYYVRTRRIFPVVLVHLGWDLFALAKGVF